MSAFSARLPAAYYDTTREYPPDLVIVALALSFFQILEFIHRRRIGDIFPAYSRLPFRDRFDWDRRALNLLFQLVQFPFNAFILLCDSSVTADYLYGYSAFAHIGFLIIIAFYIYDTAGMIMHPRPPSTTPWWIFHHAVAVGLLLYDVSYRRVSAFPAATFLISAVGHVPNELRWIFTALNVGNRKVLNACNVFSAIIVILACALPPPFLLYKSAQQLDISVLLLVTSRMRPYCIFFFLLIYIPHLGLTTHHIVKVFTHWNKRPKPFRPSKVD